jgi:N-acyl homoserine lactone hydrolase
MNQVVPMLLLLLACTAGRYPTVPLHPPAPSQTSWANVFAQPGVVEHIPVVSARADGIRQGLIDLDDPLAKAAGLEPGKVPIVIVTHVLRHPTYGDVIVDTGVAVDDDGKLDGPTALLRKAFPVEVVEPLATTVTRLDLKLKAAYLTHSHPDHILGIPDLDPAVPVVVGPDEMSLRRPDYALLRRSYRRVTEGHTPLRELDFSKAVAIGTVPKAVDLWGDGSLWAFHAPGHTPGSLVFLANTTTGPALLLGDTSHTRWGWDNGVPPGSYTDDGDGNRQALVWLRALANELPNVKVYVGHEL